MVYPLLADLYLLREGFGFRQEFFHVYSRGAPESFTPLLNWLVGSPVDNLFLMFKCSRIGELIGGGATLNSNRKSLPSATAGIRLGSLLRSYVLVRTGGFECSSTCRIVPGRIPFSFTNCGTCRFGWGFGRSRGLGVVGWCFSVSSLLPFWGEVRLLLPRHSQEGSSWDVVLFHVLWFWRRCAGGGGVRGGDPDSFLCLSLQSPSQHERLE